MIKATKLSSTTYLTTDNFGSLICNRLVGWYRCSNPLNVVSCQGTLKHTGNVCDLENRIDNWGIFARIETYSGGGIDAFGGIVTNGGVIEMSMIAMSRRERDLLQRLL